MEVITFLNALLVIYLAVRLSIVKQERNAAVKALKEQAKTQAENESSYLRVSWLIRDLTRFDLTTREDLNVIISINGDGKTWCAELMRMDEVQSQILLHNTFAFEDMCDVVTGDTLEEAVLNLWLKGRSDKAEKNV